MMPPLSFCSSRLSLCVDVSFVAEISGGVIWFLLKISQILKCSFGERRSELLELLQIMIGNYALQKSN